MTPRWDKLPPTATPTKPRRKTRRGTWRCHTCDELLEDVTWPTAERHADTHGGARIECVPPRQE